MEELRRAFSVFDKDGDSTIDVHEMESLVDLLGLTSKWNELSQFVVECDLNDDGHLDFDEFCNFLNRVGGIVDAAEKKEQDNQLRTAFQTLDKNGDGVIDRSELQELVTGYGDPFSEDELSRFFEHFDDDEDGKINYEEFVRMWRSEFETPFEDDSEYFDEPPKKVEIESEGEDAEEAATSSAPAPAPEFVFEPDESDGDVLPPLTDMEDDSDSEYDAEKEAEIASSYDPLLSLEYSLEREETCISGFPTNSITFSLIDSLFKYARVDTLCKQVTREESDVRAVPPSTQERILGHIRDIGLVELIEKRTRSSRRAARMRRKMTKKSDLLHTITIRFLSRNLLGDDDDEKEIPLVEMDPVSMDVGDLIVLDLLEFVRKVVRETPAASEMEMGMMSEMVMQMESGGSFDAIRQTVAEPVLQMPSSSFASSEGISSSSSSSSSDQEEAERKKAVGIPQKINLEFHRYRSRTRVKGSPSERMTWTIRDSLYVLNYEKTLCGRPRGGRRIVRAMSEQKQDRLALYIRNEANLVDWGGEMKEDNMFWVKAEGLQFEGALNEELEAQVLRIMKYSEDLIDS